jgi:hypothetical protein
LGATGKCALVIVTLYFFTFGAVAASAIGDTRDVSNTATKGTTAERIFMTKMVQKCSQRATPLDRD